MPQQQNGYVTNYEPHQLTGVASYTQDMSVRTTDAISSRKEKHKRNKHNDSEWARQLPRIKKMYMEDDLTLTETMRKMATTYNFHAS